MSFTLQGGKPDEMEVEYIYDFGPKTKNRKGHARKIKDLNFWVKWRGLRKGIDAKQPYSSVHGTAMGALQDLAQCWSLPEQQFARPSNLLADTWVDPSHSI